MIMACLIRRTRLDLAHPKNPTRPDPTNVLATLGSKFWPATTDRAHAEFYDSKFKKFNPAKKLYTKNQILPDLARTQTQLGSSWKIRPMVWVRSKEKNIGFHLTRPDEFILQKFIFEELSWIIHLKSYMRIYALNPSNKLLLTSTFQKWK